MSDVDINPFVYKATRLADIRSTNIPSYLTEQYAQCGEDVIILGFVDALSVHGLLARWDKLVCVEVGANHAFGGSNSYLLEKQRGVRSVLVEANPSLVGDLQAARPGATVVNVAVCADERASVSLYRSKHNELSSLSKEFVEAWHHGGVGISDVVTVPAMRMRQLLSRYVATDEQILVLSIDIEGADQPVVEDTPFGSAKPVLVVLEPSEHFHSGEGARMMQLMADRGYCLLAKTDVNLVFASRDVLGALWSAGHSEGQSAGGVSGALVAVAPHGVVAQEHPVSRQAHEVVAAFHDALGRSGDGSAWEIDEAFIAAILGRLGDNGVLSLDVFDTALTRRLGSPPDVFAEVEHRLIARFGDDACGYAAIREMAEESARAVQRGRHGAEEVTLDQIYAEAPRLLPRFHQWGEARDTELQVEREVSVGVPDILELTRRVQAKGKEFIFVSDVYLPTAFVETLLRTAGYAGWSSILVSCECGATKSTGRIWDLVGKQYPLKDLVHVGDNTESDVVKPRACGITALGYARVRSERRLGTRLTPAVVPYSLWQRASELKRARNLLPESDEAQWRALGQGFGALVVGTFVKWLAERAQVYGLDRLYFCARDGYLMQRAWDVVRFARSVTIEARYLCISRMTLNLAAAAQESTRRRLSRSALSFLSSSLGQTSVGTALARIDLDECEELTTDVERELGGLDVLLSDTARVGAFERVLARHTEVVYGALEARYASCLGYLRQEGLLDGARIGIVDMGWHGTLQRSLSELGMRASPSFRRPIGFYYGLWRGADSNRFLAGVMESCFATPFVAYQAQSELQQGIAFMEELHSAPGGSTIGYRVDGNKISPVFQTVGPDQAANDQYAAWFQEGVLSGVSDIFSADNRKSPISADDLSRDVALAAMGSVFLSPSASDLALLKRVGHCATFDHGSLPPVISEEEPSSLDEMRRTLSHSEWGAGQLRLWWLHGGEKTRALVREVAPSMYPYFGSRVLRQFA